MIEHIYRNIYIGNSRDAADLSSLRHFKIGAIINCAQEISVATGKTISYLHIYYLPDMAINRDIAIRVRNFVAKNRHHNILVHCHVGMERSPSISILILMMMGMKYNGAFRTVHDKRTEVEIRIYPVVEKSIKKLFGRAA